MGWLITNINGIPTEDGVYAVICRKGFPTPKLLDFDNDESNDNKYLFFKDIYCYRLLYPLEHNPTRPIINIGFIPPLIKNPYDLKNTVWICRSENDAHINVK
jgi:hypothetical protein